MDIHRCRFVDFPASPISAVSFSRSNDKGLTDPRPVLKLAIGRTDGSIEIWNPDRGHWVQEVVFPGGEGRSIEGLVWTQDPDDVDADGKPILGQLRLFSIGSTSSVTEWDLRTGKSLRVSTGNFSEVWCLAAQPKHKASRTAESQDPQWIGQDLVAGCGDGTLAILSTADDDLTFKRYLARAGSHKTSCMSVTWQDRVKIVAGFSDSCMRVYDSRNGNILRTMSLGAGIPGAPKDTLVWRVKCLPNGDIVSADSNGELRFWDGKLYNMVQRVSGHDSDCLDLITSSDGQTVFSGGIDGKIATYRLTSRDGEKRRWAKLSHRRIHQGDVKSMAVYDSKQMSVVVTGGTDTEPTVLPLRELQKENHRRLPGLPQKQPFASASQARLVASWWHRTICIWRIGQQDNLGLALDARSKHMVSKICIKGDDDVSDVAFSQDGRILVVTTSSATKMFHLRPSKHQEDKLRVSPLELPNEVAKEGARRVSISPDCKWISTVTLANDIKVMSLLSSGDNGIQVNSHVAELEPVYRKITQQTGLKAYDNTITQLVFSGDGSGLCIADISGHIDYFKLTGEYDSAAPSAERGKPSRTSKKTTKRPFSDSDSDSSSEDEDDLPLYFSGQTWSATPTSSKLPKLDSLPLVLTFNPVSPHLLLAITQHHNIYEFDMNTGKLSDWSRRNPSSLLPAELRVIKDRITGCIWDISLPTAPRIWLHGSSWLGMLDISQDLSSPPLPTSNAVSKRKRDDDNEDDDEEEWTRALGRKGTSGAGDRMEVDLTSGVAVEDLVRSSSSAKDNEQQQEEEDDAAMPLARDTDDEGGKEVAKTTGRKKWWCTFKYRPILGVAPLASSSPGQAEEDQPVEVVLVERPVWDLAHLRK